MHFPNFCPWRMQHFHVFFTKNGSNVRSNHGPRIVQVVPQQHHIAHACTSASDHSMQSVSTASSDSPGLNEEWSKLHLAKSFGKRQAIGNVILLCQPNSTDHSSVHSCIVKCSNVK